MPPRIPATKSTEVFCYGVAGVGVFAPLCLMFPGAQERLATQTARWAPRWERNIAYFAPSVERGIKRVEPPVAKMVKRLDERLPLEKVAKNVDGSIKKGLERLRRQ